VEINGEQAGALHLFASRRRPRRPPGGGVTVYGDACTTSHRNADRGQTVYLSAGAVVRGQFVAEGADHISIRAPASSTGARLTAGKTRPSHRPVQLHPRHSCRHDESRPRRVTVNLYRCEDVTVRVNIIGARSNSDGISRAELPPRGGQRLLRARLGR
jgi:hypothetical protein